MVRLKDIAARAGVSVMTVSKSLRDETDISIATKTRIKLLAQQMGYVPDSAAQTLRTSSTRLFGLIISGTTNPIFARMLMAIEERAHELGHDLILGHSLNLPEREEACIRRMLSRRVQGLFIAPVYRLGPTAPIYEELERRLTPVVLLGRRAPFCSSFANVETDDLRASQTATEHLLQLGHRRIAYFCGPREAPSAQERFEGYRRALREAGLDVDDRLVFQAGHTIEEGVAAASQFLSESPPATAIQAVDDLVALGVAHTLLNQGVRIPQDLSVVGFGNILAAEYFRVPLTTIRQPKFRLGVAAMDVMGKLLRGEKPATKRLPAELVVRASTGAVKSE
ncbi:MAG: LacI family DNA-binding transcriptional regulator [Verrucomicrobia bacterium]|nr:LacI family DNA-binding transcriptional regulator [Verrucomicrobiota bacterium]